jgi:hypothetical protein
MAEWLKLPDGSIVILPEGIPAIKLSNSQAIKPFL